MTEFFTVVGFVVAVGCLISGGYDIATNKAKYIRDVTAQCEKADGILVPGEPYRCFRKDAIIELK